MARNLLGSVAGGVAFPVVNHPGASAALKQTATELATELTAILGIAWPRVERTTVSGPGIYLGSEWLDAEVTAKLGDPNSWRGMESYAIRSDAGLLRLMGYLDNACAHAAFAFLHDLGWRQWFPGPVWKHVPALAEIYYSRNCVTRPVVSGRNMLLANSHPYEFLADNMTVSVTNRDQYDFWLKANRLIGPQVGTSGHIIPTIIGADLAWYDADPANRYAINTLSECGGAGGVVTNLQTTQLRFGNAEARNRATQWCVDRLTAFPLETVVSVEPNDGVCHDTTAASVAYGTTVADRQARWANEVAVAIWAAHASRRPKATWYAYSLHADPPTDAAALPMQPNTKVQVTRGFNTGRFTFYELIELWRQYTETGVYEYYSVFGGNFDYPPGGSILSGLAVAKKYLGEYAGMGVSNADNEFVANFSLMGRGYHLAAHLMWNPLASAKYLYTDFLHRAYGTAHADMRRFHNLLGNEEGCPGKTTNSEAARCLQAAWAKEGTNPTIAARLRFHMTYIHYLRLWDAHEPYIPVAPATQNTTPEARDSATALIKHCYRNRHNHAQCAAAFCQYYAAQCGVWHGLPGELPPTLGGTQLLNKWDWLWRKPNQQFCSEEVPPMPVWRTPVPAIDADPTNADIDADFASDLAFYPVYTYKDEEFDLSDPVKVSFAEGSPQGLLWRGQAGARFLLLKGAAPTTLRIIANTLSPAGGPDEQRTYWEVTTLVGQVLLSGWLDAVGNTVLQDVVISLPAGAYYFITEPFGNGAETHAAASVCIAFAPERGLSYRSGGGYNRLYFYLPKGNVGGAPGGGLSWYNYLSQTAATVTLYDPSSVPQQVNARGEVQVVTVAAGQDGKPWSHALGGWHYLHIHNGVPWHCPNQVNLIVPRDVAIRDGLSIVPIP